MNELALSLRKWTPTTFSPILSSFCFTFIVPGETDGLTLDHIHTHRLAALLFGLAQTTHNGEETFFQKETRCGLWLYFHTQKKTNNMLECKALKVPADVAPAGPLAPFRDVQ